MTDTRTFTRPTPAVKPALVPTGRHATPPPVKETRSQRWRRRVPIMLVLLAVALLYQINIGGWPVLDNDDEGTYVAQAWAVLHQQVMAHYTYWYDHPPLGWIQVAVLLEPAVWLTGLGEGTQSVMVAGRAVMGVVAVVNAALLYRLAVNLRMPPAVALVVPLVWAFSPLTQYFGRQVFLDNLSLPWLLGAFVLVSGRSSLARHVLAGAVFGIAVLSKETALLALPGLMLMLWRFAWTKTRVFAMVGAAVAVMLTGLAYLLFAGIKGEIFPGEGHVSLVDAMIWQVTGRQGSGWAFDPTSLSYDIVDWWVFNDGWLLSLGLMATAVALFYRSARPIALVVIAFLALGIRPSGYLPFMYAINLLPWMALLVVFVLWKLWSAASHRKIVQTGVAVLVALLVAVVYPSWSAKTETALTADTNDPYYTALEWMNANLPRDTVILTDDNSWNDLVALGWSGERFQGPVWHFKLDRDPEADVYLPNGWEDVDYVFMGAPMSALLNTPNISPEASPQVWETLQHSELVVDFGKQTVWGSREVPVQLLRVTDQESTEFVQD
jgi:hypothetical protein